MDHPGPNLSVRSPETAYRTARGLAQFVKEDASAMIAVDDIDPLEAMARYAAGDASAFPIVHDHVAPIVHAVLRRHLSDRELVQDGMQATFMRAHRARASFRAEQGIGAIRPWFATLARRVALDMLRGRGRAQQRIARAHREMDWLDQRRAADRPDERWEAFQQEQQAQRVLGDLMQRLPSSQREVLHMHVVLGETFTSMAARLGTSATNLRVRAHRARTAIRRMAEASPASKSTG